MAAIARKRLISSKFLTSTVFKLLRILNQYRSVYLRVYLPDNLPRVFFPSFFSCASDYANTSRSFSPDLAGIPKEVGAAMRLLWLKVFKVNCISFWFLFSEKIRMLFVFLKESCIFSMYFKYSWLEII